MPEGSHSFSSLVHNIAASTQSALQAKWVAVLLRSEDSDWYVTSADTRADAPFIKLRHNSQTAKWLESEDAVLRATDPFLSEPNIVFDEWDEALFEEHGVELAAPVRDGEKLIGLLVAGQSVAGNAYPVSALNYLKSISSVAGFSLAARLEATGTPDAATGTEDQLLRKMAHDLKGPLATVMTYLDLIRQNKSGNLNDRQLNRIDKANRSGRRLLRLLNDFVDFARLRAGTIGLERSEFTVGEMAQEVSDSLAPVLSGRNQDLRCTVPATKVTAWADRTRVTQLVTALVSNASRYSGDGIPIDLEIWSEGNQMRIRVTDRGRGLDESQQRKVFEPFDADQPSRRSENDESEAGSGLGLVLARGFAQLHGGTLALQSGVGKGTIVDVAMPVILAGEAKNTEAA